MPINPLAEELNAIIRRGNPHVMAMLSKIGRRLYFPKGILSQSAEARQKAYDKFNATIGIATENLRTMCLPTVMSYLNDEKLRPSDALTYASSFGIPGLRQLWRELLYEKNASLSGKAVSLPVVTSGITHGIAVFAEMFLDPDDIAIFPDKMWGNNTLILSVRQDVEIRNYPMFAPDGGFNVEGFETAVRRAAETGRKVLVFLNFPNNPTGYTVTRGEGDRIVAILKSVAEAGANVLAVTDDAYFGLRYDDRTITESLFGRLAGLHERILAVKLDGATKELFVWGLRVGFVTYGTKVAEDPAVFYEALERKTAGCVRGMISNASHLSQSIVMKALKTPEMRQERLEKVAILKRRAEKVKAVARDPKYADAWTMYPFNSGYFMCLALKTAPAEALRVHLLDTYRVGVIATGPSDIRVAFSSVDEENIPDLFEFIYKAIKDLAGESGGGNG